MRRELPQDLQDEKGMFIQKKVLAMTAFKEASTVYLYMDFKGEVQTSLLLDECFRQKKRVVLPRIDGDEMDFYEVRSREELKPGYFGILEPVSRDKIDESRGFMVVPGVAFSKDGYRMGYGKGFYDRYLTRYPGIYTCGICYDCQVIDDLIVEEHDRKLDELVTG